MPTADPRFRRTERLRIEVPLAEPATEATGRMLTREGQPMPLVVTYSSRVDEATQLRLGVADVTLVGAGRGRIRAGVHHQDAAARPKSSPTGSASSRKVYEPPVVNVSVNGASAPPSVPLMPFEELDLHQAKRFERLARA